MRLPPARPPAHPPAREPTCWCPLTLTYTHAHTRRHPLICTYVQEKDGIDYAPVTVNISGGEEVPFMFAGKPAPAATAATAGDVTRGWSRRSCRRRRVVAAIARAAAVPAVAAAAAAAFM